MKKSFDRIKQTSGDTISPNTKGGDAYFKQDGAPCRIRTNNLLITSELPYHWAKGAQIGGYTVPTKKQFYRPSSYKTYNKYYYTTLTRG